MLLNAWLVVSAAAASVTAKELYDFVRAFKFSPRTA